MGQLLDTALRIYARLPLLFTVLAGTVVVPYEVVVLLVSHGKHVSATAELLLTLANLALVNPCVAAMVMQALIDLGEGRRPHGADVIRRGLMVLPVVAAAEIVAQLAEFAGFLLVIPGVIVAVRLAVAAQVAATEKTDWPGAIRRSVRLTRGNFLRVLGLVAIQWLLTYLVALFIAHASSPAPTVVGLVLGVLSQSFCTLLISLLYFDLRARDAARVA